MFRAYKVVGGTASSTGVDDSLPMLKFQRPARGFGWRSLRRRPMVAKTDCGDFQKLADSAILIYTLYILENSKRAK